MSSAERRYIFSVSKDNVEGLRRRAQTLSPARISPYLDRSITATANEETLIRAINFAIAPHGAKPQHPPCQASATDK
jgi:hypothetical protein